MSSRRRPEGRPLRTFRFDAAGVRCDVAVGPGALALLPGRLGRIAPGRWFVVSSAPVMAAQGARLREALEGAAFVDPEPFLVPDGEAAKSWPALGRLLAELSRRGLA